MLNILQVTLDDDPSLSAMNLTEKYKCFESVNN